MTFNFANLFKNNGKWLEAKQNTILSAATIISVANFVSLFAGLLRERLLIARFFESESLRLAYEAFKVAFQIPNTMFQIIILGALSATLIPIFTQQKKHNEQKAFKMGSIIFNYLLLIFVIFSVIVYIFADPITRLRTGNAFTPDQIQIVINLTRLMLVSQLFFAVSNFMTGILQSYQRFIIPAFSPILYNLGILAGVFFFSDWLGVYSAGLGVVLGAFLHMIVQVPLIFKLKFHYSPSFNIKDSGVRKFFKLSPPRALSLSISEIRKLSLGFFATSLGNLSFLIMDYSLTLMAIPIRFFGVSIGQAALPFLSEQADETDKSKFRNLLVQSHHQIAFFSFPAAILLLILKVPVVRLIYGAANFPWSTTTSTGRVLAIISLSIVAQSLVHILVRAFYALKDTKTPLIVTALDTAVYLTLCSVFTFRLQWGVLGIGLATTITGFLEYLVLLVLLHQKIGGIITKALWVPQFKMIATSFFMAVFLYLPFKILGELVFDTTRTVELIGLTVTTGTIGILVYLYFAILFDVRELQIVIKLLEKFGSWQLPLQKTGEVVVETPIENDEI